MAAPTITQGLPNLTGVPLVYPDTGIIRPEWASVINALLRRTGGANNDTSLILDTITDVVGAMLYRAAAEWTGLDPAADFFLQRMIAGFPSWGLIDQRSFAAQARNKVFAGPTAGDPEQPTFRPIIASDFADVAAKLFLAGPAGGGDAVPTFRNIATLDMPAGQYPGTPTNDNANTGNAGEYTFSEVAPGSPVSMTSGVIADVVGLLLSPGDWDVWGILGIQPNAATTTSIIRSWISSTSATDPGPPNQGAYWFSNQSLAAGTTLVFPVGQHRVTVAAGPGQFVQLSAQITFAVNTLACYGSLSARRAR